VTSMRILTMLALVLSLGAVACQPPEESEPAPEPAPQTAPAPETVSRSQPPLPAPNEAGLSPRHGGLIATAGPFRIELVVLTDTDTVTIHLYGPDGSPLTPAAASGTLAASWRGGETTVALVLQPNAAGGTLTGAGSLPPIFAATVDIEVDGTHGSAKLRWASGGVRGSSGESPQPAATP